LKLPVKRKTVNKRQINVTSNDYSAIKPYVDTRNRRIWNRANSAENAVFITRIAAWGKWLVIGIIALGIAILLAQSYFRYQKTTVNNISGVGSSVAPVVTFVPVPDPELSNIIEKIVIVEKPVFIPPGTTDPEEGITVNFTIFNTKQLDSQTSIVTGWKYESSKKSSPESEYCYVGDGSEPELIFQLAQRVFPNSPNFRNIPDDIAADFNMSASKFQGITKHCRWFASSDSQAVVQQPSPDIPSDKVPEEIPDDSSEKVGSTGTAFFINEDGALVTNHHVVDGCQKLWVQVDGLAEEVSLVGSSSKHDLAIVRYNGSNARAPLKIAEQVRLGESVVAFGYPLGDQLGAGVKVTTGNISSLSSSEFATSHLQFTAPIQPGNSGGPLVNQAGLIVGVNAGALVGEQQFQNLNFAVKTKHLIELLGQVGENFGIVSDATEQDTAALAEQLGPSVVTILCQ
jgi:S1-C subfamily serine protease